MILLSFVQDARKRDTQGDLSKASGSLSLPRPTKFHLSQPVATESESTEGVTNPIMAVLVRKMAQAETSTITVGANTGANRVRESASHVDLPSLQALGRQPRDRNEARKIGHEDKVHGRAAMTSSGDVTYNSVSHSAANIVSSLGWT